MPLFFDEIINGAHASIVRKSIGAKKKFVSGVFFVG